MLIKKISPYQEKKNIEKGENKKLGGQALSSKTYHMPNTIVGWLFFENLSTESKWYLFQRYTFFPN